MSDLHPRMFIAQLTLEQWLDTGNVDVADNVVHLKNLGRSYSLEPAVRFLAVVPDGAAPGLIGKVLTDQRVLDLGGESMSGSVLFGEAAFEVEAGFVGVLQDEGTG